MKTEPFRGFPLSATSLQYVKKNIELAKSFSGSRAISAPPPVPALQRHAGVLSSRTVSCAASASISFHSSAACRAVPVLICNYAQSVSRDLTIAEV